MDSRVPSSSTLKTPLPAGGGVPEPERWVAELGGLLAQLREATAAPTALPPVVGAQIDNQLVAVRLGIASALFAALQCRNAATAGHALRVALTCSAWSVRMNLPAAERDAIEVAALLHDIGVIGVPDQILLKPGSLDADETARMIESRRMSLEILRPCCPVAEVLSLVEHVSAWFNGNGPTASGRGAAIPRGARMIAIAEAYDAMITDRVYRPALSQEQALVELFHCAGTQFDPDLIRHFAEYHLYDQQPLHREVAARWLQTLDPQLVESYWHLNCVPSPRPAAPVESHFQGKLLDNMYDAVVFIDTALAIVGWNHGAERLTGITANSIRQRAWQSALLGMCDEKGRPVQESDCPVRGAIQSGVQSLRRMTIAGRGGRPVAVDLHAIPVAGEDNTLLGAVLLLHDASSETSLEQRCQSLYEKATKDPLTQVANRAEFDRVQKTFIAAHQQQQVPCAMIMCDIDRFKLVNDNFGHQAGDDAIKSLAALLKSSCRPGDLVARYGGEEFVMLCADCDNATAARRAEQIRKALSQMPQPKLDGRAITASFGVTEIQPGDNPETMLRRADRALLMAKAKGRNQVIQLGSGAATAASEGEPTVAKKRRSFWSRRPDPETETVLQQDLITPVPIKMAVDKLRGFVADHQAKIVTIEGNSVRLEICDGQEGWLRRRTDRSVEFYLDLVFEEEKLCKDGQRHEGVTRTRIHTSLRPKKNRNRRQDELEQQARRVLASFRSYLMALDASSEASSKPRDPVAPLLSWATPENGVESR